MAENYNLTALLALAFGAYALAAGFGMLRHPRWGMGMIDECERSAALRFLVGIVVFVLGTTLVLVHPMGDHWLSILITVLGWIILVEGLVLLAFPGLIWPIAKAMLASSNTIYALAAMAIGIFFIVAAFTTGLPLPVKG
ncbi:hypothetical protein [Alterisphingorhabdus coralli]|uniref:DUF2065 domain-containing protein n=1 Tax=Alterisphingorhabdus coralli TaxID=3071408 RepID=A0AA97F8A8_9SPHN|nr:hypothetical protein [Parasphingorhabdus sp. SCSIO 66989]WOE74892.1 hypothetical protein RB602_13790 [Parasphingorhabdus sp. SCSIO 66989]